MFTRGSTKNGNLEELVVEVVGDVVHGVALVQEDLVDVAPAHRVDALVLPPVGNGIRPAVLTEGKQYVHFFRSRNILTVKDWCM